MPAEYLIDRTLGVVFSRAWGALTNADLLEHQRRLGQDPEFEPSLHQLFDFEDVTDVKVTALGIRVLAQRTLFGAGARRAFTVSPGAMAMYGLMRMFQILTSEHPDELRVHFDHINGARRWLGIPDADGTAG